MDREPREALATGPDEATLGRGGAGVLIRGAIGFGGSVGALRVVLTGFRILCRGAVGRFGVGFATRLGGVGRRVALGRLGVGREVALGVGFLAGVGLRAGATGRRGVGFGCGLPACFWGSSSRKPVTFSPPARVACLARFLVCRLRGFCSGLLISTNSISRGLMDKGSNSGI